MVTEEEIQRLIARCDELDQVAGPPVLRMDSSLCRRLLTERDHLQRFKDWTHARLDAAGVPHHPPGVHGEHGCRIGDRMDWVFAERDRLAAENERLRAELGRMVAECRQRSTHSVLEPCPHCASARLLLAEGGES